jgi:hypothetical protein
VCAEALRCERCERAGERGNAEASRKGQQERKGRRSSLELGADFPLYDLSDRPSVSRAGVPGSDLCFLTSDPF